MKHLMRNALLKKLLTRLLTVSVAVTAAVAFSPLLFQATGAQTETCRVFPETGRLVCGKFLAFWNKNGGLAVFGYLISNMFAEQSSLDSQTYMVQYFQRAVFELHPENKPPHDVQLAHLGVSTFASMYQEGKVLATYPLYPKAQSVRFTEEDTGRERRLRTSFETTESATTVLAYYERELTASGWEMEPSRSADAMSFIYREEWDIPQCLGDERNRTPFIPCATLYFLSVETKPAGSRKVAVTVLLTYSTFCCLHAKTQ
jgi:hypothetical protein